MVWENLLGITKLPMKIGEIYFHGSRASKKIALTFDDGPSMESEKILDFLKKEKCKATFFVCGKRIKRNEKIVKRIVQEGHEIGNHTFSHASLIFKKQKIIEGEIRKTDEELLEFKIRTKLFRPPSARIGFNLLRTIKKLNKKIVLADVLPLDYKGDVKKTVENVLRNVERGSIIDFHDYIEGKGRNKQIIQILKKIIPKLKKRVIHW